MKNLLIMYSLNLFQYLFEFSNAYIKRVRISTKKYIKVLCPGEFIAEQFAYY